MARESAHLSAKTRMQFRNRLTTYLYPKIGNHRVDAIEPIDLLAALRGRGQGPVRHRAPLPIVGRSGDALCHCHRQGQAGSERRPAGRAGIGEGDQLRGADDTKDVGKLLLAIDGYAGFSSVMSALRLAPVVFVRPGELRGAEWNEIDLAAAEWRIPAARMKMKQDHIVPLSRQAVAILREQREISGQGRYVFPVCVALQGAFPTTPSTPPCVVSATASTK